MHDEAEGNVIDLPKTHHAPGGRIPSPAEILANPKAFMHGGPAVPPPSPSPAPPVADDPGEGDVLAFERLSLLPRLPDPYVSHARPVPRGLPMLALLDKDCRKSVLSYGDLRVMDEVPARRAGNGPGLLLRFLGVRDVELEGRNLDNLLGYLYLHRLAWLRVLPDNRTVKDDRAIVITAMHQAPLPVLPPSMTAGTAEQAQAEPGP